MSALSPAAADRLFVPAALNAGEARDRGQIAEAMAAVMLDRTSVAGACDVHDLAAAGFTAAEIVEYEREARAIADRAATRQDAGTALEAAEAA